MDVYSSNDAAPALPNQSATHSRRCAPDRSACLRPPSAEQRQSSWTAPEGKLGLEPNMRSQLRKPGASNFDCLGSRPASLEKHGSWQSAQTTNADKWFDDSNKNVRGERGSDYMDDDPPFYLRERPDSEIPFRDSLLNRDVSKPGGSNGLPDDSAFRSYMQELDLNRDSSEDYRSVIDDLTIQNQRLKKKLRNYQRVYSSHLQEDKLFEVTFHGLSAEKREELEDMLREFASSLDESSPNTTASSESINQHPALNETTSKVGPSYASQSRPDDSGYGSMYTSGRTSTVRSHQSMQPVAPEREPGRDVQSYLKDTPFLNNHAKKELIVKRLEQLFTGKTLRGMSSNQVLVQQNVSGSTTDADRMDMDDTDQRSNDQGVREARILPVGHNFGLDLDAGLDQVDSNKASGAPSLMSTPGSSEQRPTRPLDLDLRRTQYPAENVDYIRHLGMSTPSIDHAVDSEPTDGWVYFNLLVNMAQLHTVNVTSGFIKQAVSELSTKLELSEDGRKIRWKGGSQGTNSTGGADRETSSSPDEGEENLIFKGRQGKRGNGSITREYPASTVAMTIGAGNGLSGHPTLSGGFNDVTASSDQPAVVNDRFYYKPMFFHETPADEEDSDGSHPATSIDSSSTPESPSRRGDLYISDEILQGSVKRRRNDREGPLVFYKRAKFCTDLSGDRIGNVRNPYEGLSYEAMTEEIVGCHSAFDRRSSLGFQHRTDSPLLRSQSPATADKVDESATEESIMSFNLEPVSAMIESRSFTGMAPSAFDASGLAGVHPADHFLINVQIGRKIMNRQQSGLGAPVGRRGVGRIRNDSHFREYGPNDDDEPYTDEILSATRVDLPPSTLPPPSCIHQPGSPSISDDGQHSSTSSDTSSNEDYDSHSHLVNNFPPPQLTHMLSTISTPGPGDSTPSQSSSIDILASLRKEYPLIIAEQEKEYDDRYDDLNSPSDSVANTENKAGSLAATAGDQSSSSSSSQFSSRAVTPFTGLPNVKNNVPEMGSQPYTKMTVDRVDTPVLRTGRDKIPKIVRGDSY